MTPTSDGATPVPATLLTVLITSRSTRALDAHALLLRGAEPVCSGRDVVFYNAPRHPSQAVTLSQDPEPGTARLSVSLPRTPADVHRIVVAVSVDGGPLGEIPGLTLTVLDAEGPVARCDLEAPDAVRAIMFGEFGRAQERWFFHRGGEAFADVVVMFTAFGIPLRESSPHTVDPDGAVPDRERISLARTGFGRTAIENKQPPPDYDLDDWYPDPVDSTMLRWWDGSAWTEATTPAIPADPRVCVRCGRRRGWRIVGTPGPCRDCAAHNARYLAQWRIRARKVLTTTGPRGPVWDDLWTELRRERIGTDAGRAALRGYGLAFLERVAAFADGEIEAETLTDFEAVARALALSGPQVEELRRRVRWARTLTRLRSGELPVVDAEGLHLDPDERVHLTVPATRIRRLARGPRTTEGRLICSSKKLRFVGPDDGLELTWSRVVAVSADGDTVAVAATSARGGAEFDVEDADLVAAVLEGSLRVAKRLALVPGRRDSRAIPPEIKAEVWQRDAGRCVDCGATHYLEFDHIIPLSRGGATSPANLQVLCRACNRSKGARI